MVYGFVESTFPGLSLRCFMYPIVVFIYQEEDITPKTGTVLVFVGCSGAGEIIPLMVSHVESESGDCWTYAIGQFKKVFGSTKLCEASFGPKSDTPGLIVYADLGKGFLAVAPKLWPNAHIAHCIEHRKVCGLMDFMVLLAITGDASIFYCRGTFTPHLQR